MKLFRYEGYDIVISEEAMLLTPFRNIWQRDKSRDKLRAKRELGYIYFMEDPRSDYQIYIDRNQRSEEIKRGEGIPEDWTPDETVQTALEFYASFKSEAALLLEDTRAAINNLRTYLKEIDLTQTDNNGKPIYTINTYTSALAQLPKLVTALDEAEKAVAREIIQSDKVRGSTIEKSMFEDDL